MSGFLDEMARSSEARAAKAKARESLGDLMQRAANSPAAPPLKLSTSGFDVIAELKLRSPAAGALGSVSDDWRGRIERYARAGAAAVSVLTEPSRFDGSLEHLTQAAAALRPLKVPAMRKDFIVDPYQIVEARAGGAGGVLLILRMVSAQRNAELLDTAAQLGLFVLLEAFDEEDLAIAEGLLASRKAHSSQAPVLIGINCRDLQSLKVVPERFEQLAPYLPKGWPAVAESGVASPQDALAMRGFGYAAALIGTALMQSGAPDALLSEILDLTRTAKT